MNSRKLKYASFIAGALSVTLFSVSCSELNKKEEVPMEYDIRTIACIEDEHYDNLAGTYRGAILLSDAQGQTDSLAECSVTFGNHGNKTVEASPVPVKFFARMIPEDDKWYDVLGSAEETMDFQASYSLLSYLSLFNDGSIYNEIEKEGKPHNFAIDDKDHTKTFTVQTQDQSLVLICSVSEVSIEKKILRRWNPEILYNDGVSIDLQKIVDLATNDTIEMNDEASSHAKLLVKMQGIPQ